MNKQNKNKRPVVIVAAAIVVLVGILLAMSTEKANADMAVYNGATYRISKIKKFTFVLRANTFLETNSDWTYVDTDDDGDVVVGKIERVR